MQKNRMEAFSDGVLAIIITIMVLELKPPHDVSIKALLQLAPALFSYILSFIYVAIYWNNHHHLLHTIDRITGSILWANNHLLFWLSLIPFATAWAGENHFAALPVALYGIVLLMAAIAYFLLSKAIMASQGTDKLLARAIGRDKKGKLSVVLYALSIPLAFVQPFLAILIFWSVATMWLIPDARIERALQESSGIDSP